ncbi:MAG: hypothetical protein MJY42_02205 [Bacteroidales bacterium]|nr:hypothetical protein [Bacteroidales bacterium]
MDIFSYNKPAGYRQFVGRKQDVEVLKGHLNAGTPAVIYEIPRYGKASLIQQTLFTMKSEGCRFRSLSIQMLNLRSAGDILCRIGSSLLGFYLNTADECGRAVAVGLEGTHFTFNPEAFSAKGVFLKLTEAPDENDVRSILRLPARLCAHRPERLILILNEFQNIMIAEHGEWLCSLIESEFKLNPPGGGNVSWLLCGSQYNAMNDIFEIRRFFYRQVKRVKLGRMDKKVLSDYIIKSFLSYGKVIDRDLTFRICEKLGYHPGYINHICSSCDGLSKGFITETTVEDAMNCLINVHEPRFISIMNDLTGFQVRMLRAVVDGNIKFSSADVIRKYDLHSSANVKRLREALCKKEIISFTPEEDLPFILDPLFDYWIRKVYFEIKK